MRHLQRRAAHLLNTINHRQYDDLCELLGGHGNEAWHDLAYSTHGEPSIGGYGLVRRIHFDLDYHNFVLAQVWAQGDEWEHVLFYNTGENEWVPTQAYSWGTYCPSYAEAGEIVDEYLFLKYDRA